MLIVIILLHTGMSDLLTVIVFAGLILAAVTNTGRVAGLLNTRPLTWLGDISYSLYLIHGFVQYVMTKLLVWVGVDDTAKLAVTSAMALTLGMLCVSLLIATITYGAVEKSGRRYLRDLFRIHKPSRAVVSRDRDFGADDPGFRSARPG
jgi:peptidoglycan/LPS O-acetylase OafA/YrhL